MKKIIAVILTFAVCFAAFCIPVSAASPKVKVCPRYYDGYTYVGLKTLGNTVYYTTDGSKPDRTDSKYTSSVMITEPCTLRMAVYKGGKVTGRYSARIKVQTEVPDISVKSDDKGKYIATITVPEKATVYYSTTSNTPAKTKKNKLTETTEITVEPGTRIYAFSVKKGWKDSFTVSEKAPSQVSEIKEPEAPAPEPTEEDIFLADIVKLINAERKRFFGKDIIADPALNKVAEIRAEELTVSYNYCRPNGSQFNNILGENGIVYGNAMQTIAKNLEGAEEVFEYWKNSGALNACFSNSDFNRIGLGYVESEDESENYWVLIMINMPY